MELEKVAEIFGGILTYREANKFSDNSGYEYSLFDAKGYAEHKFDTIRTKNQFFKQLTKEGDIIFRLVSPNKVVYIDKSDENLLVPAQYAIIRCHREIDPVFLKWYLESDLCKEELLLYTTGSTVQKIPVNSLKKITVPIIDIETQKALRDLIELWDREKVILDMIKDKKEKLYNSIIEEIIEEKQI